MKDTTSIDYTNRLLNKEKSIWKRALAPVNPYKRHIRAIAHGKVLEVGCGVGRILGFLDGTGIGVDHNSDSVIACRKKGLEAFTPKDFFAFHKQQSFDTLITSHVLEHMNVVEAVNLMKMYSPYLVDGARVIAITPQQAGFQSDPTHIEFMDFSKVGQIFEQSGCVVNKQYSFPFPRWCGSFFVHNEFVTVGTFKTK